MKRPVVLCIMDGFGINPGAKGNAIEAANTPNLTKLFKENPFTTIGASGLDVGLPDGQMGNSEVGHTNIGAGRVVYQMLVKISKSIQDGEFFNIKVLKDATTIVQIIIITAAKRKTPGIYSFSCVFLSYPPIRQTIVPA